MTNETRTFNLLCWNVRGLGESSKCPLVRDTIQSSEADIVCIQDSKLAHTPGLKARTFLPARLRDFRCVDAAGSRGGLLTAWDPHLFRFHTALTIGLRSLRP